MAAVVGSPVGHSLSPVIHNAGFAHRGIDWIYVAFEVAAGHGGEAVSAMRHLGLGGLSVTMPLKAEVAGAVDRLSPVARTLGAVNTVVRQRRELVGHSTDGEGFLDALAAEIGFSPERRRCLVVGAGGAGRAVVLALARAGASEVVVVNRSRDRGTAAAALAPRARVGSAEEVADVDLVVNATPVGMAGTAGEQLAVVDPDRVGPGQVVVELAYSPPVTDLMRACAQRGATVVGGVGMLVHQAARAFTLWTGEEAPVDQMAEAARVALAGEGTPA